MTFLFIEIIALLIVIFFTSSYLISIFNALMYRIFKNKGAVIKALAFFLLPGTFLHEMGHLLFAEALLVRTDGLTVVPELDKNQSVKLGSVKIAQTDPLRRTIIGLAPVFFGIICIWIGTYFLQSQVLEWPFVALYFYLLLQISLTMFSSSTDLQGTLIGILLLGLLVVFINFLSQVVVFDLFVAFKLRLSAFIATNLVYLRDGLGLALIIQLIFIATILGLKGGKSK